MNTNLSDVVAAFGFASSKSITEHKSGSGFSGATLWRVETDRGSFCLRRWPAGFRDQEKLLSTSRVLALAARNGCEFIPVPIIANDSVPFVTADDCLWEMTPWMAGQANFNEAPSAVKLSSAMTALAKFHQVLESVQSSPAVPLSVSQRVDQLRTLPNVLVNAARNSSAAPSDRIRELAIAASFKLPTRQTLLLQQAADLAQFSVRVQPVIRDIWHEHVLFTGDRVTGIVDFGAMRVDTVACDLARLLGSIRMGGQPPWQLGLQAYQQSRPLQKEELGLIPWLHETGVVLGLLNWIEWILVHQRQFPNWGAVAGRMEQLLAQL